MRNGIILTLIAVIIGLSVFNLYNIHITKEEIVSNIEKASDYANANEFEKACDIAKSTYKSWQEKEKVLRLFCRRNNIDEVSETLAELYPYAEQKNKSMFLAISEKCKNRVDHIWQSEIPTLDTLL